MNNSHYKWLLFPLFLFLMACGGGSNSSETVTNTDTVVNTSVETETDIGTEINPNPSSANPAQGLVANDLALHPMQAIAKPGYLQTITDPSFGTTIRRITDAGAGNVIKPMYSTIQAWNADESYLVLYDQSNGVHILLDGHTYTYIRNLDDVLPDDIEQIFWDYQNLDIFYYVDKLTAELIRYTVSSRIKEVLANLATLSNCDQYSVSLGNDVQMMSYNSDVFGFRCGNDSTFSYRVSTGDLTTFSIADVRYLAPMPAPGGNLLFHHTTVYGADGVALRELNRIIPNTRVWGVWVMAMTHYSLSNLILDRKVAVMEISSHMISLRVIVSM